MSSTTERARGQALAVFTLSLTALLLTAALAFDGGAMLVERRDQQNAADAAAMAGARYVLTDKAAARSAAIDIASVNGYTDGVDGHSVIVSIPPRSGPYATWPGAVGVEISSGLPPIFGGILSLLNDTAVTEWRVDTRAVAAIFEGVGAPFGILALDPTGCEAILVSGNGAIDSQGNIQVNSTCPESAFKRQGGGTITVGADNSCNAVGGIQDGGGKGYFGCTMNEGAPEIPDPLIGLPPPPMPGAPLPPVRILGSLDIPAGCPGSATPATIEAPATCQFQSSYAGTGWRLYPGLYPGGIKLQGGTFYLEPGIYYLAGGGLDITGNGTTTLSVAEGGTTLDHGVLFYNTQIEGSPVGPISLNGADADIDLYPLKMDTIWDGLVIYQDRTIGPDELADDVTINGSDSDMSVRGSIYVPTGDVKVNGSAGQIILDQVIAYRFKVNGQTGSVIRAMDDLAFVYLFRAAGLVE